MELDFFIFKYYASFCISYQTALIYPLHQYNGLNENRTTSFRECRQKITLDGLTKFQSLFRYCLLAIPMIYQIYKLYPSNIEKIRNIQSVLFDLSYDLAPVFSMI